MSSSPAPLRIAIAEDRPDFRAGLVRRLGFFPEVEVVLAAPDGQALLHAVAGMCETERPDVVLMDLEMPGIGGIEATARLTSSHPDVAVVILTVFDDDSVLEALEAGACGYLLKEDPVDAVVAGVLEAARGGAPLSLSPTRIVVEEFRSEASRRRHRAVEAEAAGLTPREREVLALLALGETDEGVAYELCISVHTVRSHTKALFRKLGIHSRAEAARWAAEHDVV